MIMQTQSLTVITLLKTVNNF